MPIFNKLCILGCEYWGVLISQTDKCVQAEYSFQLKHFRGVFGLYNLSLYSRNKPSGAKLFVYVTLKMSNTMCVCVCIDTHTHTQNRTPLIRIVIYSDRLGPSGKFIENTSKLNCLEITGYHIKYSTVFWFPEPPIRRGRHVQTEVHTVNSNSRTSD